MTYEKLCYILMENTKASGLAIEVIVNDMTYLEYNEIPIMNFTEESINVLKSLSVIMISRHERCVEGEPYYELYYVAPSLFKILNENKCQKQ